jgi:sigma-E factor negative regulatory protein RseC
MIETPARVVRSQGDTAWVRVESPAACGACGGKGCGASLYARMLHPREPEYAVDNPIGAQPGERVVIGIEDGAVLRAAVSAYLIPLALLSLGAAAGSVWGEGAAVIGGLLGLALGLLRMKRQGPTGTPVILRRAAQGCGNG